MRTMRKIVKIEPYYEPRMWGGGSRLKEEFHYATDVAPLGEVYNVVALPGHADCFVPEMNCTLSQLYGSCPEWFECETKELPIRVNILDPMADLSIQIHPDDAFAKQYNGGRGKPEAWVILDAPTDGYIEFGHHAKTHEQFKTWSTERKWDKLLRYLKTPVGGFIDIPAGTLHAIGKWVLTYNISRNADCTLRLYDYDRIDPATGAKRAIQVEEVLENVNIPDRLIEFQMFPSVSEHGCQVSATGTRRGCIRCTGSKRRRRGVSFMMRSRFIRVCRGKERSTGFLSGRERRCLFLAIAAGSSWKERWICLWPATAMKERIEKEEDFFLTDL